MDWLTFSNFGTSVTILGACFSGLSWYKTKSYYSKIAKNNSFEKLSSLAKDLVDISELYANIKKFHYTESKRGKISQKIVDYHLEIANRLSYIRNAIPSKYETILYSISDSTEQLDKINKENLHYETNPYFNDLGTQLANIENGVKLEKEELRGF